MVVATLLQWLVELDEDRIGLPRSPDGPALLGKGQRFFLGVFEFLTMPYSRLVRSHWGSSWGMRASCDPVPSLLARTDSGALLVICAARARAALRVSLQGTTRLINPTGAR